MRVLLVQGISPPAYWGYGHSLPPSSARVRRTRPSASRCSRPAHLGAAHQVSAPLARGGRGAPPRGRRPRLRHARRGVLDARDARPRGEVGQGHHGGWPGPHHQPRQLPDARYVYQGEAEGRLDRLVEVLERSGESTERLPPPGHRAGERAATPRRTSSPCSSAGSRRSATRPRARSSGASPLGQNGTEPWARAGRLLAPGPGGRTARVVRMWILP